MSCLTDFLYLATGSPLSNDSFKKKDSIILISQPQKYIMTQEKDG